MRPSDPNGASNRAAPGPARHVAGRIIRIRRLPLWIFLTVATLLPRPFDALELPNNVAAPVNTHGGAVPDTKGVVLDLLALDRLAAGEAFESRSRSHADGLGEHRGQPAVIDPLPYERPQG